MASASEWPSEEGMLANGGAGPPGTVGLLGNEEEPEASYVVSSRREQKGGLMSVYTGH